MLSTVRCAPSHSAFCLPPPPSASSGRRRRQARSTPPLRVTSPLPPARATRSLPLPIARAVSSLPTRPRARQARARRRLRSPLLTSPARASRGTAILAALLSLRGRITSPLQICSQAHMARPSLSRDVRGRGGKPNDGSPSSSISPSTSVKAHAFSSPVRLQGRISND